MMRPVVIAIKGGAALLLLLAAAFAPQSGAMAGGRDAAALAEEAAMAALNGVPASACSANGQLPPLGRDSCLDISPARAAQADRGLMALQAFLSPDVQPLFVVVGRGIDGEWGLWLAGPAAYVPVALPGDAQLCGTTGAPVRVEPSVDAPVRTLLPDRAVVTVDRFVLNRPGTWRRDEGGTPGDGWYHVAVPVDGWVTAADTIVADADCAMALR